MTTEQGLIAKALAALESDATEHQREEAFDELRDHWFPKRLVNPLPTPSMAKKSGHTPGSWVVHHDFDDGLYRVVLDENGPGQCVIAEIEAQQEEHENAHLIAAAPELLEACRDLVARWDGGRRSTVSFSVAEARRAIAKAEQR